MSRRSFLAKPDPAGGKDWGGRGHSLSSPLPFLPGKLAGEGFQLLTPSYFKNIVDALVIVLFAYCLFVVMFPIISKPLLKAWPVGESW